MLYFVPRQYFAYAVIEAHRGPVAVMFGGRMADYTASEIDSQIHRPEVLLPVIQRLDLRTAYGWNHQQASEADVLRRLAKALVVRATETPRRMEIGVRDRNPMLARDIVNATLTAYGEQRYAEFLASYKKAMEQFAAEIEKQRLSTIQASQKVATLRSESGIDDPNPEDAKSNVALQKLGEGLASDEAEAKQKLAEYLEAKNKYLTSRRILEAATMQLETETRPGAPIYDDEVKVLQFADLPTRPAWPLMRASMLLIAGIGILGSLSTILCLWYRGLKSPASQIQN